MMFTTHNDGNNQDESSSSVLDDYELTDEEPKQSEKTKPETALVPFDPFRRYLMEISKYPLLTREEEQKLAQQYFKKGDPQTAYILIVSNLRLVVKIALEYQKSWVTNIMDLIQEGNIGLIQAVKKFDPLKQTRLSYYASFWIKAYILKHILDNWRLVKIGTTQAQRKLFFNLAKEKARLTAQGFEPDIKHLAKVLGVREKDVLEMNERLALPEKSLDQPVSEHYQESLKEQLPSRDLCIEQKLSDLETKKLFQEKLREFQKTLKGKERDIFENRLLSEHPETLQQIGKRYGITRERIRQLEVKLIQKLKGFLQKDGNDMSDYHITPGVN